MGMDERERAAGLDNTMSGRSGNRSRVGRVADTAERGTFGTKGKLAEKGTFGTKGKLAEKGTFGTKGRLAGEPKPQRDSEDGIETVEVRRSAVLGGSIHAFQLVKVAINDLCVRQGTINSVIPTISGTALAVDVEDNSLSLPGTGTREYWLKVTLDANGDITTVTIEITEPSANSATQAKLLLGSVETNSGNIVAFNSNLSGSQSLASCGATHYFGVV